ncbi:MAG: hypothetical protein V1929_02040 [bacterium]
MFGSGLAPPPTTAQLTNVSVSGCAEGDTERSTAVLDLERRCDDPAHGEEWATR